MKKPRDRIKAIADRLGPNASEEQIFAAYKADPQAIRQLLNLCAESAAEVADRILRQLLDNDPDLALSIMRTLFGCRSPLDDDFDFKEAVADWKAWKAANPPPDRRGTPPEK
jgi:hypothetical protein